MDTIHLVGAEHDYPEWMEKVWDRIYGETNIHKGHKRRALSIIADEHAKACQFPKCPKCGNTKILEMDGDFYCEQCKEYFNAR